MTYDNITQGLFVDRPNRFVARVIVNGKTETVHVKNTGRCKELLIPGAQVWVTEPKRRAANGMTKSRKTRYDLIAVRKRDGVLYNIDSQAPNTVIFEWLATQSFDKVVPEYRYGDSRIDFYMEKDDERYLMEVKGCTLEVDGIGYFPDAPTDRGVKHIQELIRAVDEGYHAILAFVIQMDGVTEVRANTATHPEFGEVLEEARAAGVKVRCFPCHAEPDALYILPGTSMI